MKDQRRDEELQAGVIAELHDDELVHGAHIGVSAERGAVTLTGEVSTEAERLAATQAAKRVSGVIAVADDMQVRSITGGNPTDTDVAVAVVSAFDRLRLADGNVKIDVIDHIVILSGEVRRSVDRDTAEDLALGVPGVVSVVNKITVGPPASESDVRRWVMDAFLQTAARQAEAIAVSVADGDVVLSGSVRSLHDRGLAEEAAWATPGVRSVRNHLHVHA